MKTKTKTIVSNIVSTAGPALTTIVLLFSAIQPALAANDTWLGNTSANWGDTPNNWTGGNNPPVNGDSLIFGTPGSSGTTLVNTLTGLATDGITFSPGGSTFTFNGNNLLLSAQLTISPPAAGAGITGISNFLSSGVQTFNLPMSLDWGCYQFVTAGGTMAFDGGLTLVTGTGYSSGQPGGVAYFEANYITTGGSTPLTTDASGLIAGLDGNALIYNYSTQAPVTATASAGCLATVSSGSIVQMGFDTTLSGGGSFSGSAVGNNVVITDSGTTAAYNFLNCSVGTITCLNTGSGAAQTQINVYNEASPGFYLSFGNPTYSSSGPTYSGGLYVPNANNGGVNVVSLYGGNGGSITAGWPAPGAGTINLCVNGGGNSVQQLFIQPTCSIIDNPAGGAVTVVKSGTGTVQINSGIANGGGAAVNNNYSGGTYVNQGYLKALCPSSGGKSALGTGPVYIAAGAAVFLTSGTWNNNFYLSPGLSIAGEQVIPSQGSLMWSSTSTLTGTITLMGAPTLTSGFGDKISDNTSGSSFTMTGQITGTGTLELGGANGNHTPVYILNNQTANPNNWTGGLIMDLQSGLNTSTMYVECFAANQMGTLANLQAGGPYAGNVTIIPDIATAGTRFDIHGNNTYIGGLYTTSVNPGGARIFNSVATPANLYIGANNASATFAGVSSDSGTADALNIVKIGTGTQTMSGQLGHHGTTTVSAGELIINYNAAYIPLTVTGTTVNGGILDLGGTTQSNLGPVTISSGTIQNGTMIATSYTGAGGTVSAVVAGSGTWNQTSGTTSLTGVNTYSGTTTITGGTLDISSSGSILNTASLVVNSGGTLELDNNTALASTDTLGVAVGGTVNLTYGSGTQTINALYVGGVQQPPGVYGTANNPNSVFTGSGTLTVASGPPLPITSSSIIANQLNISWTSVPGGSYQVYTTTSLVQPITWTLVATVTGAASPATSTSYALPGNINAQPQLFVEIKQ